MKMSPVIVRRTRRAYRPMRGLGADLFDAIAQATGQPVSVAPSQPSGWDFGPGNVSYGADSVNYIQPFPGPQQSAQPSGWDFGPANDTSQFPGINIVSTQPGVINASPSYTSNTSTDWGKLISSVITGAASVYGAKTAADAQVEIAKAKAQATTFNPFGVTDASTNPFGNLLPTGNRYVIPQQTSLIPGVSNNMLMYMGIGAVILAALATR